MTTFSHLAPELLAHILKLSTEGEPAQERQRFRLAFGLISRASFLITADATEFCVEGVAQAKAFLAQFEKEKKWAAQEERKARSGRTSRSALTSATRVSNIRRLTLIVLELKDQKVHADLLRATPNLIALELVVGVNHNITISSQFAMALGGLLGLRELQMRAKYLACDLFLKCLNPLKALEVLDLGAQSHSGFDHTAKYLSAQSLPNIIEPLLLHVTKVVYLTWDAPLYVGPVQDNARDAVLALLGAMTQLMSLSVPTWINIRFWIDGTPEDQQPIDHTLFDTLATLPSLHNLTLNVNGGHLSTDHVVTYLESHKSLRSLSFHFSQGTWTREEREAVEEAADRAGVAFS
ncbi:hypothetical protein RQP46_011150 [Phenoliferia psychrophenolica]